MPPREITRLAEARLLAYAEHRAKLIADAKRVVEQWRVKDFFGRADVSTSFLLSSVAVGGAADVAGVWIGGPVGGKTGFSGNRQFYKKKQRGRLSMNGQSPRGIRDLDNFSKSK